MAQAESAFDTAYSSRNSGALAALLAGDVTLKGDGEVIEGEVRGRDAASKVFSSYLDHYGFSHTSLLSSTKKGEGGLVTHFNFWADRGVQAQAQEGSPLDVLGVWKLVADGEGHIKEIWCLRQPTAEERGCMAAPPVSRPSYDAAALLQSKASLTKDQLQKLEDTMHKYQRMWFKRESALASEILAPHFDNVDFMRGHSTTGRDAVVEMIKQMPTCWKPESSSLDFAFVPGTSMAFGHWTLTGQMEGEEAPVTLWGLGVLQIDPETLLITKDFSSMYMGPMEKMAAEGAHKQAEE